jgi:hypothetical protein
LKAGCCVRQPAGVEVGECESGDSWDSVGNPLNPGFPILGFDVLFGFVCWICVDVIIFVS